MTSQPTNAPSAEVTETEQLFIEDLLHSFGYLGGRPRNQAVRRIVKLLADRDRKIVEEALRMTGRHNFPHCCRDGHEWIGFANGPAEEAESCPVCLVTRELAASREECARLRDLLNDQGRDLYQASKNAVRFSKTNDRDTILGNLANAANRFDAAVQRERNTAILAMTPTPPSNATPHRPFKSGDTVFHRPTGETWSLIADELDGRVRPGGWPETMALAADCELRESAMPAGSAETRLNPCLKCSPSLACWRSKTLQCQAIIP